MKNKNWVKIILIAILFIGGGFVGDRVKAVECCVTKKVSDGTPTDCRVMGSTQCDTTIKGAQTTNCPTGSYLSDTLGVKRCRFSGSFSTVADCPQGSFLVSIYGKNYCDLPVNKTQEEQVSCALFQVCRKKASKELTDCSAQKTAGDCGLISSALCFWSANRNKCFSVNDPTNCPDANATDCGYLQPAGCQWDDNLKLCQTTLSAGVSGQYETKGEFLPSCAAAGQCRRLSDIFVPVLRFVDWIFRYIGAIAFIFFVYGGFTMILSFGNSEKFKKGQQILVAAVIGLIIVFSAYLMVSFLLDALGVSGEFKVIN